MNTTFDTYRFLMRDLDTSLSRKAAEPIVSHETAYFEEHVGDIKSIDDFFKDTRLYTYAMKAFGLEDMTYAKAYMRKVVKEGVDDKQSFANRLNDERFVQFAAAFDFTKYGDKTMTRPEASTKVVDMYVRQSLEVDEGAENDGVRLALYFQRMAPTVKTAFDILADPALTKVAKVLLQLPEGMGNIDQQAKLIEKRLDIGSLQDPKALDTLIQRFSIMYDSENGLNLSPIMALFTPSGSSVGVDVALTLLSFKYGG